MGFRICDRDTDFLMPPSLQDWVPADHFVRLVVATAERIPLRGFVCNRRGTGSDQYHPCMMLAVLVYYYALGDLLEPADRAGDVHGRGGSVRVG